jgi:hypothetical protein
MIYATQTNTQNAVTATIGDIAHTGADTAKNTALNSAINASGVKNTINQALHNQSAQISAASGIPQAQVDSAISNLDIDDWQAASVPSTATAVQNHAVSYGSTSATITTYNDPSYVSVQVNGQTVSMKIPDGAQDSLSYLSYLS